MSAPARKTGGKAKNAKPGKPIEFFTPPNTLRVKLKAGAPSVHDPLAAASLALDALADEAKDWVAGEIARIDACRADFMAAPADPAARDALLACVIDISGLAPLAGNDLAARFAANLTRLLGDAPGAAAPHADLVAAHVDAIRAAAHRDDPAAPDATADALAAELETRVDALLDG